MVSSELPALGMRCWKPGSRLDGAGFSGDGFLAMPSDHLRGVEGRTEGSGPCGFLMSRDATRRHHDDTSMHGPIRCTFYQRARREQEGRAKLRPPLFLAGERATFPWLLKVRGYWKWAAPSAQQPHPHGR